MAEEQVGLRKDHPRELPSWMKLFTAFKVALDPKKLLLAAAGILVMAFGWWLLAVTFFMFRDKPPEWSGEDKENEVGAWKDFKDSRSRWNLLYEMAGPVPAAIKDAYPFDAADLAGSLDDYKKILAEKKDIEGEVGKRTRRVFLKGNEDWTTYWLAVGDPLEYTLPIKVNAEGLKALKKAFVGTVTAEQVLFSDLRGKTPRLSVREAKDVPLVTVDADKAGQLDQEVRSSKTIASIEEEIRDKKRPQEIARLALSLVDPSKLRYKPSGKLRTWPWFEDRGPNPYLLVTGNVKSEGQEGIRNVPWERGQFLGWVMNDQASVLVEPLVKFLGPIVYLFDPASGGWNRLYLFLVILWTLATWALFGGAITRMAAVQIARPNEKVGMTEAVRFAWSRYKSFFSAPLFPLLFIVVLTVFLIVFGLVELIPVVGDIFVAGLFWPLVLLVGLIMAVVLVGLIGWPLMYSTISTEGSDSFDAISRSYSYVYQAPWHYLWYSFVALLYGAVLVFFVGFMGSLMVYLSKWGVSQAPSPASREPSYLFAYTPTSFGWRDLMLYKNPNAETVEVVRSSGAVGKAVELNEGYRNSIYPYERVGAFLVSIWIYLVFLMVVGFGYSYFWTASTIIYLLMRRQVDDTEMDEVHLEEEEFEEPYPRAAQTAPAAAPAPVAAAAPPRTMVESPTFRAPPTPAPVTAAPLPAAPPNPAPVSAAPKTQLAPEPPPPPAPKTQLAPEPHPEPADAPTTAPPHGHDGNAEGRPAEHEGGSGGPTPGIMP